MVYIYPGRFQPFHNDHLFVVNKFIEEYPNDKLVLAIVRNVRIGNKMNDYDKISEEHFSNERNPFDIINTLSMINSVIHNRFPDTVYSTLIPRPSESLWYLIKDLFPEKRTWVIPQREEEWDEKKSNFFRRMGDSILRIKCNRKYNGMIIRELFFKRSPLLKSMIPHEICKIMESK